MLLVLVCGFILTGVSADYQNRIIGGQDADPGEYPHQVSLQYGNGYRHFCGGSIVGLNWILTAAHCVYKFRANINLVTIWVDSNKLDTGGTRYLISQIISHEQFNDKNFENDVALIQLTQNIAVSSTAQIIPLAVNVPPDNAICQLSGWGYKSLINKLVPNELQELELKIISLNSCRLLLSDYYVFNTNMCAFQWKGQGACSGDSGGPLLYDHTQIGIVSWGIPCAEGKPDVYTSVHSFRAWIREKSGI